MFFKLQKWIHKHFDLHCWHKTGRIRKHPIHNGLEIQRQMEFKCCICSDRTWNVNDLENPWKYYHW